MQSCGITYCSLFWGSYWSESVAGGPSILTPFSLYWITTQSWLAPWRLWASCHLGQQPSSHWRYSAALLPDCGPTDWWEEGGRSLSRKHVGNLSDWAWVTSVEEQILHSGPVYVHSRLPVAVCLVSREAFHALQTSLTLFYCSLPPQLLLYFL